MRKIFKNSNNKEKIDSILKLYIELIDNNKNKSKDIMMLVPNNIIKSNYEKNLNLPYSEELNITTYINFIKKELVKFWPVVTEKCKRINKDVVSPTFIPSSLTEYIINNKVKTKRNLDGYFEDITSTNKNISMNINTNINKAALSLIDFTTI
ncbi:MAG: hypothetical protein ACRC3Y_09340, partial [Romboutsia sp.]